MNEYTEKKLHFFLIFENNWKTLLLLRYSFAVNTLYMDHADDTLTLAIASFIMHYRA